jgi:hypothetical protein
LRLPAGITILCTKKERYRLAIVVQNRSAQMSGASVDGEFLRVPILFVAATGRTEKNRARRIQRGTQWFSPDAITNPGNISDHAILRFPFLQFTHQFVTEQIIRIQGQDPFSAHLREPVIPLIGVPIELALQNRTCGNCLASSTVSSVL